MSPGSMMLAKNWKENKIYLLGVYVGYMTMNDDYKYKSTDNYYYLP
ncbi:MAG: hypothetical protein MJ195_02725 [Mycoplasmoidaceae bacterium]|nr:hypothetical protein [Mycoplasmoidaceae bacterium]